MENLVMLLVLVIAHIGIAIMQYVIYKIDREDFKNQLKRGYHD